jgi:alpha-maltose-1-phosphate synthase
MSKLTLFFGGSVGSDPYSVHAWSGISSHLVKALDAASRLDRAIGVAVPRAKTILLQIKNFHLAREAWRTHYYFDPAYRKALTRAAARFSVNGGQLLQIGHMFSLPEAFPGKFCVSYHDGNLAEKLKSGFGLEQVSRGRIDEALRYEEEIAGQMTAIFTFSEYLRQSFISDYHVPGERVINVGAGINLTECPALDPHKEYSTPNVLFIGIEFVRKGGPQLIGAFHRVRERFPAAQLHIVGPAKLEEMGPGIVFHGRLSKSDPAQKLKLETLFRQSVLFVLPSLYEPFGIAPLEAMLYQIPCLVTDAWALREIVRPGINGDLAEKGSIDDLANKMVQLLSAREKLADMGYRGREMVIQNFTWPAVVRRISNALIGLDASGH